MFNLLSNLFGNHNTRVVKKYQKIVDIVNSFENSISKLSDEELSNKTIEFKNSLSNGKTLDDILPEAFAVVREVSKRVLGMRHFDVQIIGGIALHNGQIAEMKTGEGKTLVATLAVYLNALTEKGVHVVTVNDYLAKRDANWMGQIYKFLGLSVSTIISGMLDFQKKEAYKADISYGTNHEFGFDYLRDNLKFNESEMVMRPFNFGVIDEVDSILIDEARTPLIISGSDNNASQLYIAVDSVVKNITDEDYEKDEKSRVVTLTDKGVEKIEEELRNLEILKSPSLYDSSNISIVYHVNCALKAHKLFAKDVDYMVRNGQVLIIDEFTGRVMEGRRYSEGLHQAIEAKEGVTVQTESQTIATISYQNLFRMYPKLAGMTGTAMTEEQEFDEIYKLKVVSIPSNKKAIRIDHEDSIFLSLEEKDKAVISLIKECLSRKQPVLVGTTSLERSEYISNLLNAENIKHNVLNAKQHEREAYIIAEAGAPGTVTIATNMAGRGTDIKLGGCIEMRTEIECKNIEDPIEKQNKIDSIKQEINQNQEIVTKAGGLFVIGTERNDSRRIDNQLRGRSGRQGDPGASKYFLSVEDDLIRKFGSPNLAKTLKRMGMQKDEELTHRWISKAIEKAQQRVEGFNFDIRKQLLRFDDVMNDQRKIVYEQRLLLMKSDNVSEYINDMIFDVLENIINTNAPINTVPAEWKLEELSNKMKNIFKIEIDTNSILNDSAITSQILTQNLEDLVNSSLKEKSEKYGEHLIHYIEKEIYLKTLDMAWRNHLLVLEHLRRGINLRAYAQKNPLNEYKFEAFNIFQDMLFTVKTEVLTAIFKFELQTKEPESTNSKNIEKPQDIAKNIAQEKTIESQNNTIENKPTFIPINNTTNISRNSICSCGSGKRYKHCCGSIGYLNFNFLSENKTNNEKADLNNNNNTAQKDTDSNLLLDDNETQKTDSKKESVAKTKKVNEKANSDSDKNEIQENLNPTLNDNEIQKKQSRTKKAQSKKTKKEEK